MSNQTKRFMSKDNIQVIISIFSRYMEETYKVTFAGMDVSKLKMTIFSLMNTIMEASPPGTKSIHQMNLEVLTAAKAHYLKEKETRKPNILNLSRDTEIYGSRQVSFNELIPQHNPYDKKTAAMSEMDKVIAERDDPYKKVIPDITKLGRQVTEKAESSDDFMKKLKVLEEQRNEQQRLNVDRELREATKFEDIDPKIMYQMQDSDVSLPSLGMGNMETQEEFLIPDPSGGPTGFNVSSKVTKIPIQKYLSINSTDREWESNTLRYNYAVTFNSDTGFSGNYKNIKSISVGKVVIPEEITEFKNILNFPNKTQFNHEFSFSYPYLILRIDEFNDVYDGTNDDVRKSFCKLVYYRSYKAPNGRGYVILKPLQKEKKFFHPTPLGSLNRLSISLLKPNGFLLNDSADSYKIKKIYYSPYNPHYYEVVTDGYFDRNEFFVGDVVVFKNFAIDRIPSNEQTVNSSVMAVIQQSGSAMQSQLLNEFINRKEGHEIMLIGSPNEHGFYRSFMIMALGKFNRGTGQQETNQPIITVMTAWNDRNNDNTENNGHIMNSSLQNTIGVTLDVLVNDVSGV